MTHLQELAPRVRSAARVFGTILTVTLLALLPLRMPRLSLRLDGESHWSAVLVYAHQHGLAFGHDIVFTYGPLGFLTIPYYTGHAAGLQMFTDAALCLTVAVGVCLVAWRMSMLWRCFMVAAFVLVSPNTRTGPDLLIEIGLLCWGILCLVESRRRVIWYGAVLTALAVFGTLAKMSLLVVAGLSLGAIGCDLWIRNQRKLGIGLALGFCAGTVLGWMLLGQHLNYLPAFMRNAFTVLNGYDGAMGWGGPRKILVGGTITTLMAVVVITSRSLTAFAGEGRNFRWRQGCVFVWLLGLLFICWKHGFVVAEPAHEEELLGFEPMLVLALEALPGPGPKTKELARAVSAGLFFVSLLTLQTLFFPGYLSYCVLRPFHIIPANAWSLLRPSDYWQRLSGQLDKVRAAALLPKVREIVGSASVDVFGPDEVYAYLNDLNYHPRPVFQSYAAYNTALMRLNEAFYLSPNAPDYVLFNLNAIPGRFPPMEDALAFRHLLINYEPVAQEDRFLLLKVKGLVSHQPAQLTLVREGAVRAGEPIRLDDCGRGDLWMEIDLQPTWRGHLRRILHKPPEVQLAVWNQGSLPAVKFNAPAPMLAAGFWASPLLLTNQDVAELYSGAANKQPVAFSIELAPGTQPLWHAQIHFRVYRILNLSLVPASADTGGLSPTSDLSGLVSPTGSRRVIWPLIVKTPLSLLSVQVKKAAQWNSTPHR